MIKEKEEVFKIINLNFLLDYKVFAIYLISLGIYNTKIPWIDNLRDIFKGFVISNYLWILILLLGLLLLYREKVANTSQSRVLSFLSFSIGLIFFFQAKSNNWVMYILPFYFIISYYCWKFTIIDEINKDIKNENSNFNSPIKSINSDKLNRRKLASRVFNIIKNTTVNDNLRIGIYGKWGEGKTSSMKMIEDFCKKEDFLTVWFNPWVYDNNSDYWLGFINSIENALIRYSNGKLFPTFIRNIQMSIYNFFNKALPKLTIGNVLKEVIFNKNSSMKDFYKKKVNELIDNSMPEGKKIIVFIDDLDRVEDKELQINLLMGLKELVDLNKFVFIIAIDDIVIENTVNDIIPSENGRKFLNKIIDFEIYLPTLTINEKKNYLLNILEEVDIIKEKVIIDLIEYIPNNPRDIKRFIYNLRTLKPNLDSFYKNELNWHFLYLAQMLSLEYPNTLKYLLSKEEYQNIFLQHFDFLKKEDDDKVEDKISKLLDEDNNLNERDIKRINILLDALIDYSNFNNTNKILTHFRLVEFTNIISWKTFDSLYDKIINKPEKFSSLKLELKKQFIHKLLEKRNDLINKMIETPGNNTMDKIKEKIITRGKCIAKIIDKNKNIELEILKIIFKKIYKQYNPRFYASTFIEIREQEIKLMNQLIKYDGSYSLDYLKIIKPNQFSFQSEEDKGDIDEIIKKLYSNIALDILKVFEKPQGIKNLIYSNSNNYIEQQLLLKKSVTINENNYSILRGLSNKASKSEIVHENFFEYFSLLVENAKNPRTNVQSEKTKYLLLEEEFLQIIWDGVIAKVLNRRHLGTIEKEYWIYLKELYTEKNKNLEEIIQKPDWWDKIIREWEK